MPWFFISILNNGANIDTIPKIPLPKKFEAEL
jgi:hypothetical protein